MPDEQVAESSTAVAVPETAPEPVAEPKPLRELKDYTPQEYENWRRTGTFAEDQEQPKTEESAPSPSVTPDSETGKQAPKKKTAEDRKAELAAEIQELLKQRKQLREETAPAPKPEPKTESKAAPSTEATDGKPVKPKLQEFVDANKSYEEYEEARDQYYEQLAEWKADQKVKALKDETTQEKAQASRREKWESSIEAVRKDHPDYDMVALNPELQLSPAMFQFLEESDQRARLLYALGEDMEQAAKIAAMTSPMQVAREMLRLEQQFSTAQAETVPTKKPEVSRAPRPATRLAGPAGAVDLEAKALAEGDVATYMRLVNERERKERGR